MQKAFLHSGRLKDMIVTGGENVYCGEVEAVIYDTRQFVKWRFRNNLTRSGRLRGCVRSAEARRSSRRH